MQDDFNQIADRIGADRATACPILAALYREGLLNITAVRDMQIAARAEQLRATMPPLSAMQQTAAEYHAGLSLVYSAWKLYRRNNPPCDNSGK